jgi:hypothetical protein
MTLVTRLAVAFAVLALAAPALACNGRELKSAEKQQAKATVATASAKAPAPARAEAARTEATPATAPN